MLRASVLVDARHSPPPPASLRAPPGVEVLVAGPGQPIDLPASASEAAAFHALVAAASTPLCLWQKSGDLSAPGRVDQMLTALIRTRAPVALHRPPSAQPDGSGQLSLLAVGQVVQVGRKHRDSIAFRRDIARFAPSADSHRHGTRQALLAWAAVRDKVAYLDRGLVQRPPSPPLSEGELAQERARATQAALTVFDHLVGLKADRVLVDAAMQALISTSEQWTETHWGLLVNRHKPRWRAPEEPVA